MVLQIIKLAIAMPYTRTEGLPFLGCNVYIFHFLERHGHQINSDVFFIFRSCKTLLFAKRPRAHAEPLLFSSIVHLTPAHFENGFLVGNIVKSEGLCAVTMRYPNTHESHSTKQKWKGWKSGLPNPHDPNKTTESLAWKHREKCHFCDEYFRKLRL